ncbi:MAG: THUMP domain-containing protein [Candidatus Micrarchaeia archaeon]
MLLAKYSEPLLKSKEVRLRLERMLTERVKAALAGMQGVRVEKEGGVLRIACENEEEAARRLQRVFGLASIALCAEIPADLDAMAEAGVRAARGWRGSFAVRAKRTGEHPFTSEDVARVVGKAIVDATGLRVDLEKPDNELFIEVRGERAFMAKKFFDGARGLPLGSQGSMVALLKGSESALAAWMIMRRGCAMHAVHAREGEQSEAEATEVAKVLRAWHVGKKMSMLVVDAPSLEGLSAGEKRVALGRFLARVASEIARKKRASGIVSGERTRLDDNALRAIASIDSASAFPIHRPLLFLKEEVDEMASKIGLRIEGEPEPVPPFDEKLVLAWEKRIKVEKAAKEAVASAREVVL